MVWRGRWGVSMATAKQFRIICYLKTLRFWVIAENADEGFLDSIILSIK